MKKLIFSGQTFDIIGDSVDKLVIRGLTHIKNKGERISARGLTGLQAYNVNYVLVNPKNRIHWLRAPASVTYLSRELLMYFKGSLNIKGMGDLAKVWLEFTDAKGRINSNYGYYVFYQKTGDGISQYESVINSLLKEPQSRRAVINIDSVKNKTNASKDIPCNIAIHFFIHKNYLSSVVFARSIDVITGLPYDMGFFSFVTELAYKDLKKRGLKKLKLGYCTIKCNLTQLYDTRLALAQKIHKKRESKEVNMPFIDSAKDVLKDIYQGSAHTKIIKWCYDHR
ncbi:MAG: hypothetical protein A3D44_03335 [Candidatus Staskawiczbacteria bacterium RIFCSPHIGHO2_02_FULL_42_22]|uniref:Thymidylate synthase/dCMP hydroxymethylase domain-containing protein n=1 Tax=Candidatus Staskawiczbacteria bacterium RIFCSPHIGHO2_02_FULL_42_22 TaxID=1802207 RepID=A0A1G2I432_9BACT|nr:MAG: hypothetical protein A3D44_03335 [Candidatus Staskawiczbacteria bacterium RIFCSPHIGHO2_02_FULL_42_22]